jgi:hypothetical protein
LRTINAKLPCRTSVFCFIGLLFWFPTGKMAYVLWESNR